MKRVFDRLPIRRKLFLLIFTTSAVVVLLASTVHFINDYQSMRELAAEELNAQAQLILDNAEPAVLFDDAKVGKETVDTLGGIAGVRVACLYDEDRRLFATYYRERPGTPCPDVSPEEILATGRSAGFEPVHQDRDFIWNAVVFERVA